jgi:DUF971 family protein
LLFLPFWKRSGSQSTESLDPKETKSAFFGKKISPSVDIQGHRPDLVGLVGSRPMVRISRPRLIGLFSTLI